MSIHSQAIASVHAAGLGVTYRTGPRYGQQLAAARRHYEAEVRRLQTAAGEARWAARLAEARQLREGM